MRRENSSYACLLDVAILAKMSKVGPASILCPDGDAWYKPKSQSQHVPTEVSCDSETQLFTQRGGRSAEAGNLRARLMLHCTRTSWAGLSLNMSLVKNTTIQTAAGSQTVSLFPRGSDSRRDKAENLRHLVSLIA